MEKYKAKLKNKKNKEITNHTNSTNIKKTGFILYLSKNDYS